MNNKLFIKKRGKFEKRQRYRAHNKQKMNSLLDTSEIYCEFQNELDSWNDSVKTGFRILKKYPAWS